MEADFDRYLDYERQIHDGELPKTKKIRAERVVRLPYYDCDGITIYNENFNSVLPQLSEANVIITDPPYPDYHIDEYKYYDGIIDFLWKLQSRQLIFWSSHVDFPLDYSAKHIWNKNPSNKGGQYEMIYERNGKNRYCVYTYYMNNSTVAAQMTNDIYTGHKSQKPINLMMKLVEEYTKPNDLIIDFFMGSGSTLVAAKKLGRRAIGIEMNKKWCDVAVKRLAQIEMFS